MKKIAGVMVTTATERALVAWAHARKDPLGPPPSLAEAATLALDEFGKERGELAQRFLAASRVADREFSKS